MAQVSSTPQPEAVGLYDIVIAGATVVTAAEQRPATLAICDGRIAALLPANAPVNAQRTIDATGLLALPGAVDAHVHFREPGLTHKEGFVTGTNAAAAGGVTTVMVMPTDQPWTLTPEDFEAKRDLLAGKAQVDVALQAAVGAEPASATVLERLARLGAVSFELFLGDVPGAYVLADAGKFADVLRTIRDLGVVAGVTPADDCIIAAEMARITARGDTRIEAFAASRPWISEALGVARACLLAQATGAAIHLRQMSTRRSIAALRTFRQQTTQITAEVTPHNLLLTEDDAVRLGPYGKVGPPLRPGDDCEAAWEGLADGSIDIVATDHAPHLPIEKDAGREDVWKAPGGFPGLQTMLPLLLDVAAAGRLSYSDVVRLASEAPARIFGLTRKGALAVGHDADIVLVDPARIWTIRNEDQHSKACVTPFAGRTVRGFPTMVLLRGAVIAEDGAPIGASRGEFVAPEHR